MIPPRERGRYSGYLGAVLGARHRRRPADRRRHHRHELARLALVLLRGRAVRGGRHRAAAEDPAPARRQARRCKVDWLGATSSPARSRCCWSGYLSPGATSNGCRGRPRVMVLGAIVIGVLAVFVESRAERADHPAAPVPQPHHHPRRRSPACSSVSRCSVQRSSSASTSSWPRRQAPTMSGLMTIPMIPGCSSPRRSSGQDHHQTGRWKAWLVAGGVLVTAGFGAAGHDPLRHPVLAARRSTWR